MYLIRMAPCGVLCVLLGWAVDGRAADMAVFSAPPPDLRRAVQDLWENNPQVQAAAAALLAAEERAKAAAQPVYNPTFQLEGENADVNRRTASVGLTLDVFGKRKARVTESEADVRVRRAAYALQRRDIALDWLKAWTGVELTQEQSVLGLRRVELMRRFDALAQQRFKLGDIASPERDLAGLALGEAQIQQAALDAQAAAAAAALRTLTGASRAGLPVRPVLLPPPDEAVVAVPELERPEWLQAQAEEDRAQAGVTVADRNRRLDPAISLTGGRVNAGPRSFNVVGVSLSVPLPVLNDGRYQVSAARADADVAFASARATRLRLAARLQQAHATYRAMRAASESFRLSRAAAFDDRAALLDKLWQAGEISTSDYLLQLKQSLDTALSGIALENQTWQAWFDYLSAAGRLTDWIDAASKDPIP
ncbi:TolC family protein [Frateuria aurantia]